MGTYRRSRKAVKGGMKMAEYLLKHICGGAILLALSVTAYFIYCGIGHIFLKLRSKIQ